MRLGQLGTSSVVGGVLVSVGDEVRGLTPVMLAIDEVRAASLSGT